MAINHEPRITAGLEKLTSSLTHFGRNLSDAAVAIENFRLAIPTEDIRAVRQGATEAIDRVMNK